MEPLDMVIAANTIAGRDRMAPVDAFGEIRVRHFVHLMNAAHREGPLIAMTDSLVQLIRASGLPLDEHGALFCPKLGNTLLGKAVADRLGLMSGFVRRSALMDRFVETGALPGSRAILVDDVSSEGRLLCDCIRDASEDGFTIDAVFTVVDRREGDARRMLEQICNVHLQTCRSLDDDELEVQMHRLSNCG